MVEQQKRLGFWRWFLVALAIPGAVVGKPDKANAPPADKSESCIEVRIAGEVATDFSCVNAAMKNTIDRSRRETKLDTTLGPQSSSAALGTFNIAAEKLRMGQNFGHSIYPYRPAPPVYAPILGAPK